MDTDVRTSAPTTRSTPMVETTVSPPRPTTVGPNAATTMSPFLGAFFDDGIPVRLEFWDGSAVGPTDGPGTVLVRSANAINRLLWAPGELGLARAYVTGDLDMDGDIFEVLRALQTAAPPDLKTGVRVASPVVQAARQLGALRLPLARPVEEASPRGRRHSKSRDAAVISHHYDISNAFYRLVLGPSMTYSCARFVTDDATLEEAQEAKHDLVCRKLGLSGRPAMRLLDVGCGWGSMALHAARHYDAQVVGVTLSRPQADLARQRVHRGRARLEGRDPGPGLPGPRRRALRRHLVHRHVRTRGEARVAEYFSTLYALPSDGGRPPITSSRAWVAPGIAERRSSGAVCFPTAN